MIELIPRDQIPFGIPGCSYATGPFTHVNPAGSRFSDGSYGVLYLADTVEKMIWNGGINSVNLISGA